MGLREDWQRLAEALGLDFLEGAEKVLAIPAARRVYGKTFGANQLASAQRMLDNPLLKGLLATMFLAAANGSYAGHEFVLFRNVQSTGSSSGSRQARFVNVILAFPNALELGLKVHKAGVLSGLAKRLFPGVYVRPDGNPELDALVVVRGKKKQEIARYLFREDRGRALRGLYSVSGRFRVDDFGIHFREPGNIITEDTARRLMDAMAEAAGPLRA